MYKLTGLLVAVLIITITSYSQNIFLTGTIKDTTEKKPVKNAVVALLTPKDSILYKFARTDAAGNFSIKNIRPGNYVLMTTHPLYADFLDSINVTDAETKLGTVAVINKSKLLEEVIIKTGSPIKIKGDTIVYTADSFKVRQGANVEELLKKLPGIQVDKNGKITAMGEQVTKVLVDGEEFFGDDPGIATKNLRADAVDKVEVFDKKSDQATFTGIDDGTKNKTINLKLKDAAKHGFFGKAELAGGLKDNYNNTAMINAFENKRKIAAYGIMSNTGQTNLDWNDAQNYGGGPGDGMEMGISDDGGMYMSYSGGGDDGYWGGRNGIPKNWNGGLHYSNKYDNHKQSINSGYKFSKVNALGGTNVYSNTFLPDTSWFNNSNNQNFSSKIKHAFNVAYEINIDSLNSLKWTAKAGNNTSKTSSKYYSEAIDNKTNFINNSNRRSTNEADNNSVSTSLLWKHKFKKLYRTLSVNTDFGWNESKNDGYQYSLTNFYTGGTLTRKDTVDQQNIRNNNTQSISSRFAYTEPLFKDAFMELSYAISYNHNSNERIVNAKDNNGNYENLSDTLSNSFKFGRLINKPGVTFRLNKKKYSYSVGTSVAFNQFTQKDITKNKNYNYNFVNFFPAASFNYKMKSNKNLRVYYNGSANAPTLEQLQPTKDNTDPLNIYKGNPNLKQSFSHNAQISYNFYNVLDEKNLWSGINFNTTKNAFVQYSFIDSLGRRNYQTVNTNGNYYASIYGNYGFKLKKPGIRLGFGPNINVNQNIDFVNGIRNINKTNSYGISLNVGKWKENKYNFSINPRFSINHSTASVNKSANADYWSFNLYSDGSITLPGKIELNTTLSFEARQKDPRFARNNNYTKWDAVIQKKFKNDRFRAELGMMDILDQNRGYNRSFSSYNFSETYYNTLRRYWMLNLVWNFSKNGKPASGF